MKASKLLLLLPLIAILCGVLSCKKKSKNNSSAGYKPGIIDVSHFTSVEHYHITYDAFSNVDTIVMIGGGTDTGHSETRVFTYFGTSYAISGGGGTTVNTNAIGAISSIDRSPDTLAFTYSNNQLGRVTTQAPSTAFPYYTKTDTNYAWNNGDMVAIAFTSGVDSFSYDVSKTGQVGDALRIDAFLNYGRAYIKTSHVPSQWYGSQWIERYFYHYDGQGRITQFIKVKNNFGTGTDDSTFYSYQYYAF